ncbi:MAG: hypothetical protein J7L55_03325 [Desulfurococcales archaeon]|nr:hypothetical protein [Desulfurococcales archaeon]
MSEKDEKKSEPINIHVRGDEEDVEELKGVLSAISEFLSNLKKPVEDILMVVFKQFDGEKLGKEVSAFYINLINSGMDPKVAEELTKEYFRKKMDSVNILQMLKEFMNMKKGGKEVRKFMEKFYEPEEEKEKEE